MNQYQADLQMQADAAKERLGIRWCDGLRFWERSSDTNYRMILASYHWPHIITWSWFLDYAAPHQDKTCRPWSFQRWTQNDGWGWRLHLGGLGAFSFHRQTTDWMVQTHHRIVNVVPLNDHQTKHYYGEPMSDQEQEGFWATVEIMGHQQYAGFVSEQVMGGASFVRVDVPEHGDCAAFSKMFGAQSIYCITPVSEEAARGVVMRLKKQPISKWDLPEEWQQAISQGQLPYHGHDENF